MRSYKIQDRALPLDIAPSGLRYTPSAFDLCYALHMPCGTREE